MKHVRKFRCQPEAVTAARQYLRAVLDGRPREIVEAAELMTSELATNCVRHAHTDFELTVYDGAQLRVELRDSGPGEPRRRRPSPRELTGRGLLIVEAMSDEWGVIHRGRGKTVWFSLDERVGTRAATPAHGEQASASAQRTASRLAAGGGAGERGRAAGRAISRAGRAPSPAMRGLHRSLAHGARRRPPRGEGRAGAQWPPRPRQAHPRALSSRRARGMSRVAR